MTRCSNAPDSKPANAVTRAALYHHTGSSPPNTSMRRARESGPRTSSYETSGPVVRVSDVECRRVGVVLGSKQFEDRKRCRRFGSCPADPTRTRVAELGSLDRGLQSTKVIDARLITFLSNIVSDRAFTIAGESHGHLKPCHVDASVAAPGPRDTAQAPPSRPRRQTSYPTPSPLRSHRLGNVR